MSRFLIGDGLLKAITGVERMSGHGSAPALGVFLLLRVGICGLKVVAALAASQMTLFGQSRSHFQKPQANRRRMAFRTVRADCASLRKSGESRESAARFSQKADAKGAAACHAVRVAGKGTGG